MIRPALDLFSLIKGMGLRGLSDLAATMGRSISFSQYAEDIFASRMMAIGNKGFYVDVGAAYPVLNSNTYRFYLKGWSGITVEPNPVLVKQHRATRPRDTIVPVGVSTGEKMLTYYRFIPADFNTFNPQAAERALLQGAKEETSLQIETRSLDSILSEHAQGRTIDLMSIDCEGLDLEVLESSDWLKFRPNMLLIEDHQSTFELATKSPIYNFLIEREYVMIGRLSYTSIFLSGAFHSRTHREHLTYT